MQTMMTHTYYKYAMQESLLETFAKQYEIWCKDNDLPTHYTNEDNVPVLSAEQLEQRESLTERQKRDVQFFLNTWDKILR